MKFYFEQRRQQERVEYLEKTISSKDETIFSQNQTISSLEAENTRLRERLAALSVEK